MKAIYKRSVAIVLLAIMVGGLLALFSVKDNRTPRYSGYGDQASTFAIKDSETVYYTDREETYIEIEKGVPEYYQLGKYPNSCGAVAGATVVGFYDKFYQELIPDYSSTVSSGAYKNADKTYVPQLMGELYTLMRTNVDDVGVSEADCINGLRTYVENKGRSLTYTSICSSKKINESALINAINNNKPCMLFIGTMSLYKFAHVSGTETLTITTYEAAHVLVAYGLLEIKYYSESGLFRTDKYLAVSTGLLLVDGYLKLDDTGWCNAAYSVTVN